MKINHTKTIVIDEKDMDSLNSENSTIKSINDHFAQSPMEQVSHNLKMTKREAKVLKGMRIGKHNEIIKNPFSGEEVEVSPEAAALYDVILGCAKTLESYSKMPNALGLTQEHIDSAEQVFHTAQFVFRKNFPEWYMKLVD